MARLFLFQIIRKTIGRMNKEMAESVFISTDYIIRMCKYYASIQGKYPEVIHISPSVHVPDDIEDWCKRAGIRIERKEVHNDASDI